MVTALLVVLFASLSEIVSSGSASTSSTSSSASSASTCSASASTSGRRLTADGRRLGGGAPWYCHKWEFDHVEACGTVVMLILAVAFEKIHHKFLHKAEHSFVYGQSLLSDDEKDASVDRAIFGKPLRLILLARMGGEFMVLGFLAFTIWICNQQGLFDEMAKITASDMNLPKTGSDYLHMMEAVHMQLFVAMILYFTLALKVCLGADARIKELEHNRGVWVEQILSKTDKEEHSDPKSLLEFKRWRGHFLNENTGCIKEILDWQTARPEVFKNVMQAMNIKKPEGQEVTLDDIKKVCTGRFSFCTYLVFSVSAATVGIANFGDVSLLSVIFFKLFLALFHRVAKTELLVISLVGGALAFGFVATTYALTLVFKKALEDKEVKPIKGLQWLPNLMEKLSHQINPEVFVLNILQVLLFVVCHSWSGNMINKVFWNDIFQRGQLGQLFTAILYILTLIALGGILPRCIPDFAAVTALPPFFSASSEQMVVLVAVQVVDQKMVAARAQMEQQQKQGSVRSSKVGLSPIKEEKDPQEPENRHTTFKEEDKPPKDGSPILKRQQSKYDAKHEAKLNRACSKLPKIMVNADDLDTMEPFGAGGDSEADAITKDVVTNEATAQDKEKAPSTPNASKAEFQPKSKAKTKKQTINNKKTTESQPNTVIGKTQN